MARVRAPVHDLNARSGATTRLDSATAHYLTRVLRLRENDTFQAFDPVQGTEADATLVRSNDAGVEVHVADVRHVAGDAERSITLVQALAKGDKCDAIVRDATELGASRIVIVATTRTVAKLDPARQRSREVRWRRIAAEAARQSERPRAPHINVASTWSEALTSVAAGESACYCLYENATQPLGPLLAEALRIKGAHVAIAVGPEGGLAADEVALAEEFGWAVASLGPRILRTETVAAAVLGAILLGDPHGPRATSR